ncbi:Cof-type HAD-IIB family hydrolase [Clostridium carnis]
MELFISDLDGTLLNSNQEISTYSKKKLNDLIENGLNFTVATARTPATVVDIVNGINIKIPAVLMNGVLIYDLKKQEYIKVNEISKDIVKKVINVFDKYNKNYFLYAIRNNHLFVYHKDFTCSMEENFFLERCNKSLKTFLKVKNYNEALIESKVINFIIFDKYEVVKAIYNELINMEGLHVDYYKDLYGDGFYLDAYSSKASKANGIKYLYRYIKSDKLITFGDNVNDIPMFKISHECYAMSNATNEIKEIATSVIESNNDDGVVKFIEKYKS